VSVGKPEGMLYPGRHNCRWQYYTKGPLKELGGIVWCRPDFIWRCIGTTGRPLWKW